MGSCVDIAGAVALLERALLVGDRLRCRDRVDLRAEPAEPDKGARPVRARGKRRDETLEQRLDVLQALAGSLVEVGRREQSPSRRSDVVRRRQRGRPLDKPGGGLRRSSVVEADRSALELGCNRLARRIRAAAEVEGPLVGILERSGKSEVRGAPLLVGVHLEQGGGEERMGEPEPSASLFDDFGRAELVEPGTVQPPDHRFVDAPEGRGGEAGPPGRCREYGQPCAEGSGERLRHGQLRIAGRCKLERVERVSAGELGQLAQLQRAERPARSLEHELGEVPLVEPCQLHSARQLALTTCHGGQCALEPGAHGRNESDGRLVEAAQREGKRSRLGASTHWRSSTATTVGLESDSMRRTPRVARATAVGSTLRDLVRRRNACSSAAYWISGSRSSGSSARCAKTSVSTANGSTASASDGLAISTV